MSLIHRFSRFACLVAAVAVSASVTSTASAQVTKYSLEIDDVESSIRATGTVLGFRLGGDRSAAIGGMANIRTGDPREPFRGFIIDDGVVVQLDDIRATIENPIPFFPPLGRINIVDIVAQIDSGVVRVNADGSFTSTTGSFILDSGMVTGEILGSPIDPMDLTGSEGPFPLVGTLVEVGPDLVLTLPLDLPVQSGPLNITISGQVVATAPLQ